MSATHTPGKCCGHVRDSDCGWRPTFHQCPRSATVERDGKPYCKQHDPVARKAAQAARYAKATARWDEEAKTRRIERAAPELLAACKLSLRNVESEIAMLAVERLGTTEAAVLSAWRDRLSDAIAKAETP